MSRQSLNDMSFEELRDLASDANMCIHSRGFQYVLETMQAKYLQELVNAEVGSLTAASAHASMKVLEDVKNGFSVINNELMIRGKRNGRSR